MQTEVVITGVGVVSPIGIGCEAFEKSLRDGVSGVRLAPEFDRDDVPVHIAAKIQDFDPKQYVRPRKSLKIMAWDLQLGVASAQLACDQADIASGAVAPERFGVVFGAEIIQLDPHELAAPFRACLVDGKFDFSQWGRHALGEFYPLWMLKYLPNMSACHIGIAHDARGPNNTHVLGEVSGLLALSEAAAVIQRGQADAMIAGGVMSRVHPAHFIRSFNSQQSPERDHPQRASRPFDAERDGFVNGEGAAAFVLESRAHAEARGAKILARLLGQSCAFARRETKTACSAVAIQRSIELALQRADVSPRDIGHVNAHGLSATDADRNEARAIRAALGDTPVLALKSYFGNMGAGGAPVELAASVLSFGSGWAPPSLNYDKADPECPVNVVSGEPLQGAYPLAIKLAQSPMGQAAAVVIAGP